jgi:hypothetical protein
MVEQISPPGQEGWLRHKEKGRLPCWRRRGGRSTTQAISSATRALTYLPPPLAITEFVGRQIFLGITQTGSCGNVFANWTWSPVTRKPFGQKPAAFAPMALFFGSCWEFSRLKPGAGRLLPLRGSIRMRFARQFGQPRFLTWAGRGL